MNIPGVCLLTQNYSFGDPKVADTMVSVDLFAAETARLFTDVLASVGDRLPDYVSDRIKIEISRRIIEPMKVYDFKWKTETNNWAAVCAAGVGMALLHFGSTEDVERVLPMLYDSIESFLSGYGTDGCCQEGYAYWNYGFGHFLVFARTVLDYTNGQVNYFKRDIVKKIALYPQNVRMSKHKIISFSDGSSEFTFSAGAMSYLKKIYGDVFENPDLSLGTNSGNVYSIKELLWFDTDYESVTPKNNVIYYDHAQWYIKKNDKFSFAAKGGHNNEPHNHNDIGSFMIVTKNDEIPLADFGCGVYDKKTFDINYRYDMLVNSSRGHSVPVINGQYQCFGDEYRAKNVCHGDDFFSLELTDAYPKGLIDKISRRFKITDDSVIMEDIFEFNENTNSVFERIVSWSEPELGDGFVKFASAKVVYDNEKYDVKIGNETYRSHEDLYDICAYLVDFVPKSLSEKVFRCEITIE